MTGAAVNFGEDDGIFLQFAKESAFMNTKGLCCRQTVIALLPKRPKDDLFLGRSCTCRNNRASRARLLFVAEEIGREVGNANLPFMT